MSSESRLVAELNGHRTGKNLRINQARLDGRFRREATAYRMANRWSPARCQKKRTGQVRHSRNTIRARIRQFPWRSNFRKSRRDDQCQAARKKKQREPAHTTKRKVVSWPKIVSDKEEVRESKKESNRGPAKAGQADDSRGVPEQKKNARAI